MKTAGGFDKASFTRFGLHELPCNVLAVVTSVVFISFVG